MKHNYKIIALLFAAITAVYTSCHKLDVSQNNKSTVSKKEASVQIAQSLAGIFNPENGGFDFKNGLSIPSDFTMNKKGKIKIQSVNSTPQCGAKLDTTISFNLDISDTSKIDIWAKLNYELLCTGGIPSGLTTRDSAVVSAVTGDSKFVIKMGENLTLKSLNPGVVDAQYSFDGPVNYYAKVEYNKPTTAMPNIEGTFNYTFKSIIIDPKKDPDFITGGSATFASKGSIGKNVWNYKGTIKFLGGHKAQITIEGSVYTADLITGEVN
ncbi:hypothetical protein [Mucilaginibacter celer]|uniref:Uncharacterized protein n=1 Tax=Mucilaginibacter celer TaxID=2305508 RepID=A0A494W5W7_9SPHI|nr:hypothetical protein [Mucilaginibacter celer]AYL98948.1 hypothetical protein HYN43_028365 [Mucilaginibacter celer]